MSKAASSINGAIRKLAKAIFTKQQLETCSVKGICIHAGGEREALPERKREILYSKFFSPNYLLNLLLFKYLCC